MTGQVWSAVFAFHLLGASGYRAQSFFLAPGANSFATVQKALECGHEGPALMSRQEGMAATPGWKF